MKDSFVFQANCFFVDHGYTEWLPLSQLAPLDTDVNQSLPYQVSGMLALSVNWIQWIVCLGSAEEKARQQITGVNTWFIPIVVIATFLHESIFGNLQISVVFWPGKACCVDVNIHVFIGYPENAKYPPDKNCVSSSSHKIVWKLGCLSVKVMSLNQKHKIVRKVAYLGVRKLHRC